MRGTRRAGDKERDENAPRVPREIISPPGRGPRVTLNCLTGVASRYRFASNYAHT